MTLYQTHIITIIKENFMAAAAPCVPAETKQDQTNFAGLWSSLECHILSNKSDQTQLQKKDSKPKISFLHNKKLAEVINDLFATKEPEAKKTLVKNILKLTFEDLYEDKEAITKYPVSDHITLSFILVAFDILNDTDNFEKILNFAKNLKKEFAPIFWNSIFDCSQIRDLGNKTLTPYNKATINGAKKFIKQTIDKLWSSGKKISDLASELQILPQCLLLYDPVNHWECFDAAKNEHYVAYILKNLPDDKINNPYILAINELKNDIDLKDLDSKSKKQAVLNLITTSVHKNALAWYIFYGENSSYWDAIDPFSWKGDDKAAISAFLQHKNPIVRCFFELKLLKKESKQLDLSNHLLKKAKNPGEYNSLHFEDDSDNVLKFRICSVANLDDLLTICINEAQNSQTKYITEYLCVNYNFINNAKPGANLEKVLFELVNQFLTNPNDNNAALNKLFVSEIAMCKRIIYSICNEILCVNAPSADLKKFQKFILANPSLVLPYLLNNNFIKDLELSEICKLQDFDKLFTKKDYADALLSQFSKALPGNFREDNAKKSLLEAIKISLIANKTDVPKYFSFTLIQHLYEIFPTDPDIKSNIKTIIQNPNYAKKFFDTFDNTVKQDDFILELIELGLNALNTELKSIPVPAASTPTAARTPTLPADFSSKKDFLLSLLTNTKNVESKPINLPLERLAATVNTIVSSLNNDNAWSFFPQILNDDSLIKIYSQAIINYLNQINDTNYNNETDTVIATFINESTIKHPEILDALCDLIKRVSKINLPTTLQKIDAVNNDTLITASYSNFPICNQRLIQFRGIDSEFTSQHIINMMEAINAKPDEFNTLTESIFNNVIYPRIVLSLQIAHPIIPSELILETLVTVFPKIKNLAISDDIKNTLRIVADKLCDNEENAKRCFDLVLTFVKAPEKFDINKFPFYYQKFLQFKYCVNKIILNLALHSLIFTKYPEITWSNLIIVFSVDKTDNNYFRSILTEIIKKVNSGELNLTKCLKIDSEHGNKLLEIFKDAQQNPANNDLFAQLKDKGFDFVKQDAIAPKPLQAASSGIASNPAPSIGHKKTPSDPGSSEKTFAGKPIEGIKRSESMNLEGLLREKTPLGKPVSKPASSSGKSSSDKSSPEAVSPKPESPVGKPAATDSPKLEPPAEKPAEADSSPVVTTSSAPSEEAVVASSTEQPTATTTSAAPVVVSEVIPPVSSTVAAAATSAAESIPAGKHAVSRDIFDNKEVLSSSGKAATTTTVPAASNEDAKTTGSSLTALFSSITSFVSGSKLKQVKDNDKHHHDTFDPKKYQKDGSAEDTPLAKQVTDKTGGASSTKMVKYDIRVFKCKAVKDIPDAISKEHKLPLFVCIEDSNVSFTDQYIIFGISSKKHIWEKITIDNTSQVNTIQQHNDIFGTENNLKTIDKLPDDVVNIIDEYIENPNDKEAAKTSSAAAAADTVVAGTTGSSSATVATGSGSPTIAASAAASMSKDVLNTTEVAVSGSAEITKTS